MLTILIAVSFRKGNIKVCFTYNCLHQREYDEQVTFSLVIYMNDSWLYPMAFSRLDRCHRLITTDEMFSLTFILHAIACLFFSLLSKGQGICHSYIRKYSRSIYSVKTMEWMNNGSEISYLHENRLVKQIHSLQPTVCFLLDTKNLNDVLDIYGVR